MVPFVQADALTDSKGLHLNDEKECTHIQEEVLEHDWNGEKVTGMNCLICAVCLSHGTKAKKTVVPCQSKSSFMVGPSEVG